MGDGGNDLFGVGGFCGVNIRRGPDFCIVFFQ